MVDILPKQHSSSAPSLETYGAVVHSSAFYREHRDVTELVLRRLIAEISCDPVNWRAPVKFNVLIWIVTASTIGLYEMEGAEVRENSCACAVSRTQCL